MNIRLAAFMLGITLSGAAGAYDKGGHFFSAYDMVIHAMPINQTQQAGVIAFCTQLPDESQEIDATETAYAALKSAKLAYLKWGVGDAWQGNADIQKMILVQRMQHVLLGTRNVPQVQAATLANLRDVLLKAHSMLGTPEENTALCAAGLALHAYGDSFAHVDMDDGESMYVTGRGHAKHVHYPDYPLCETFNGLFAFSAHCKTATDAESPRFAGWLRYFQSVQSTVASIFLSSGEPRPSTKGEFVQALWHAPCARDQDEWCEDKVRDDAILDIGGPAQTSSMVTMDEALTIHHPSPCREALEIAWPKTGNGPLQGAKPSCSGAFGIYLSTARDRIQALTNDKIPLDQLATPDFGEATATAVTAK